MYIHSSKVILTLNYFIHLRKFLWKYINIKVKIYYKSLKHLKSKHFPVIFFLVQQIHLSVIFIHKTKMQNKIFKRIPYFRLFSASLILSCFINLSLNYSFHDSLQLITFTSLANVVHVNNSLFYSLLSIYKHPFYVITIVYNWHLSVYS